MDIGLVYMGARYYLPSTGRFANADTFVPNPTNPQSFNRYTYSYNNPVNYYDPDGHNPVWCNDPYGADYDPATCTLWSNWNLQGMASYANNQNAYNQLIYALVTEAVVNVTMRSTPRWTTLTTTDIPFLSRIVKRMIARESQFDYWALNEGSGAKGLMQITGDALDDLSQQPQLYDRFFGPLGHVNRYDPLQNIRAGIALLMGGYSRLADSHSDWFGQMLPVERWRVAVAVYNAGIGIIQDALTSCIAAMGAGACTWDNIQVYLCQNVGDEKCGETVDYVQDVMQGWEENPADAQ